MTTGHTKPHGLGETDNHLPATLAEFNALLSDAVLSGFDSSSFFNGTFKETFNALVTSDGAIVTMSLEQAGGGDMTMQFSDGETVLDCTPAKTIVLTAGTDPAPQDNYVYIPKSTKVLTLSTTGFPTNVEHIKVSYFLLPSAGFIQTNGAYIVQNWNDHLAETYDQGHLTAITEHIRRSQAIYYNGVDGNGTDGYLTPTASNVELKATEGVVYQMHRHTIPAFDTSVSGSVLVKNWSGDAYHDITNLFDITADSTGTTIPTNRYFNIVLWGIANKTGEYTPMMINLPSGSYVSQSSALADADSYTDMTIPRQFINESSTGFLIALVTIKMGTTWEIIETVDLRGSRVSSAVGVTTGAPSGGGWFGSETRIKLFPSDFITTVKDKPTWLESNGGSSTDEANDVIASVPIPSGYKATHVMVYGSVANVLTVYECDITDASNVSRGAGNINTELDITDVSSSTVNYLAIVAAENQHDIYGGYVTIAKI